MGDPILIDDALILFPFLAAQVVGWWGLYAAERALRPLRGGASLGRFLWLKARLSMGMVLPVAGVFALGSDLIHRRWPATLNSPLEQPLGMALMGALVLLLAPAFVRLAWPTRSLPAEDPLRGRLEHLCLAGSAFAAPTSSSGTPTTWSSTRESPARLPWFRATSSS